MIEVRGLPTSREAAVAVRDRQFDVEPEDVTRRQVRVRSPQLDRLFAVLRRQGFAVQRIDTRELVVEHTTAEDVGRLADFFRIGLHLLCEVEPSPGHASVELVGTSAAHPGNATSAERCRPRPGSLHK
jgi:hypothetical protein